MKSGGQSLGLPAPSCVFNDNMYIHVHVHVFAEACKDKHW